MRTLIASCVGLLVAGCSTTATIRMKYGRAIEGEIVRGDESSIFVLVAGSSGEGTISIPRDAIQDIDHPGNVAATISTPFSVAGWAFAVTGVVLASQGGEKAQFFSLLYFIAPGVALAALSTPRPKVSPSP